MSFTMSGSEAWSYNRFEAYEANLAEAKKECPKCKDKECGCDDKKDAKKGESKGKKAAGSAKPDYLDFDKDGDKEEAMSDALGEEAGMHREVDTGKVVDKAEIGKTYYPNQPKQKSSVAKRKESEAARLKSMKEAYAEVYAAEGYQGKHGQSDAEYKDGRSDAGKMVSGDSKMSGAKYSHGSRVSDGGAGAQDSRGSKKPEAQGRMDAGARADLKLRKANLKKEELELFSAEELSALFED